MDLTAAAAAAEFEAAAAAVGSKRLGLVDTWEVRQHNLGSNHQPVRPVEHNKGYSW